MKKWTSILLALALAVSVLSGCGKQTPAPAETVTIEGSASEIIEKIYEKHKAIDLMLVTMDVDLSDPDAVLYNTGLSSDRLAEAAVSETMLGQPYSLVVVKVKDASDAAAAAKDMYNNIDTRKWICVAADTKIAAYAGDVAVFFMVNSDFSGDVTTDSMMDAFQAACGGAVDLIQ